MKYDLAKLQTIHCLDAVTMRVPARWRCGPNADESGRHEEADGWVCDGQDEETGTLWINILRFQAPDASDRSFDALGTLEGMIAARDGPETLSNELSEIGGGHLWKRIFDTEEEGEPLRNYWYMIAHSAADKAVFTNFNFVLPISLLDDPEFVGLVEIMDREIRAAKIEPSVSEAIFEPVRCIQFADQVRLNLPGTMEARRLSPLDEEPDYRFYCRFEPDDIEARLWVMAHTVVLADEQTREEVSIDPEFYEDVIQRFLTNRADYRESSRVPNGVIVYEGYDDPPPADPSESPETATWRNGPFHNHVWRYFRFAHGKLRQASFLLTLPSASAETPVLRALVRFLDREIRAAEFPGLNGGTA